MAQSYRSRFLSVMRSNEAALKTLFDQLANALGAELIRRADAEGNVPRSATFDIQQAAGELVRRLFLGRNGKGEFAPFDTVGDGAVVPLSPYMRVLWASIQAAVRIPVEQNAAILANRLPPNIAYTMRNATRNPFPVAKGLVREQVFRPNPLAAYEAPHQWVDPNGYRLSDRVWRSAATTRAQIDAFMEEGIRTGRGALAMSRDLRAFLTPGESLRTTNKPYGTTASYSAMRLARTEITHAAGSAAQASAAMNPFVAGMKWNLSGSHPKIDICDQYARGGPNADGVYPLGKTPGYPPHPHCMCWLGNVMIENPDAVLEQLRADVQAAKQTFTDLVGPLEVERFTQLLLGQGMETEYQGAVTRMIPPPVVVKPPVVQPTTIQPTVTPPPPPPPVDLAAEARRQVIELDRRYNAQIEKVEDELIGIAGEISASNREIDRLDETLRRTQDPERAARLQAQLDTAREARFAILDRRRAIEVEQGRLEVERSVRLRAVLEVDSPAQVTMNAPDLDTARLAAWQRGVDGFNRLVSSDVTPARMVNFVDIGAERSNYNPDTKVVRIGTPISPESAVVHELGHWLEDHNPDLHRRIVEFYEKRTQGYPVEWMGAGFRRNEVMRRDKFMDEYMGKEYISNGDRYATEILSMGIQFMYDRPAEFARRDPEMFDFIFNLARGNFAKAEPTTTTSSAPLRAALRPASAPPRILSNVADAAPSTLEERLDQVFKDYRAAKGAGDQAKMDALKAESEQLKRQIELANQAKEEARISLVKKVEPGTATEARQKLAEMEKTLAAHQQEITRLHGEYSKFSDAMWEVSKVSDWEKYDALLAQRQSTKERLEHLQNNPPVNPREAIYVRTPSNTKLTADGDMPSGWQTGIAEFNKLVSSALWNNESIGAVNAAIGTREHAMVQEKKIVVTATTTADAVIHELGHILETNPVTLNKVLAFYDRRTAGESLEKMSKYGSNYRDTEVTRPDRFLHPYVGSEYLNSGSQYYSTGGRYATEVVSMGIQWMYNKPIEFAKEDPDMFDFIFDLLRGR